MSPGCLAMGLFVLLEHVSIRLGVSIDLVLEGVELAAANPGELPDGNRDVGGQGDEAHDEERGGVVRRGDGREHIGELRHGHDEHDPKRQRLRAVLQPGALLDEERRDGAGQQKRQAAVSGMIGDAVVGVGEVPQVVGDDPRPDHVGPDHVAALVLRDDDAEPAADGDDVQDAGDAVHDVPGAGDGPEVLDDAARPQTEAEHLEIAYDGLGDVDGQDERREAQRPLLLVEVVNLAVLARPLHEAQRHEADAARER